MTALSTKLIVSKRISFRNISVFSPLQAYWNKDWLPGSFPKTEEERKKAAERYKLHPKEYNPYQDNGFGHGDYPKLPFEGVITRDPHYPYDDPTYKRNFSEPIHVDIDMIGEDRYDAGLEERYSKTVMIGSFIGIWGLLFGLCYFGMRIPIFQPVMEKQYPWKGKIYHTFEKTK